MPGLHWRRSSGYGTIPGLLKLGSRTWYVPQLTIRIGERLVVQVLGIACLQWFARFDPEGTRAVVAPLGPEKQYLCHRSFVQVMCKWIQVRHEENLNASLM